MPKLARVKSVFYVLLLVVALTLSCIVYISREEIGERYQSRYLLYELKQVYGSCLRLERIDVNNEEKHYNFIYVEKYTGESEMYNQFRATVKNYLRSNPGHVPNNGHKIEFTIKALKSGPIRVSFANYNYSDADIIYDELASMSTYGFYGTFDSLSELSAFYDIKNLRIYDVIPDDLSIFKDFNALELLILYDCFSEEDILEIRQMLPDSIIDVN